MFKYYIQFIGLSFSLALLSATSLCATTFYVSKSGSDSSTCTSASPCLTIRKAAGLATHAGDVVQVGPGTYSESVTITSAGSTSSPITFRGQDGSGCPTTADPDPNSRGVRPSPKAVMQGFLVSADHISIDCFEVTGGSGAAVEVSPSHGYVNVSNVYAHDTPESLLWTSTTGGDPTTRAHDVSVTTSYAYRMEYGMVLQCNNCVIQDNEIERQRGTADNDYSRLFGNTITFRHNYFHGANYADCQANGISCHIDCWQTWNVGNKDNQAINVTLDRNVCFNSHEGIIAQDYASTSYGGWSAIYNWTVTNNVFAYGPNDNEPWCADFEHVGNVYAYNNLCATGGGWSYRAGSQGVHKNNIHVNATYGTETSGQITGSGTNLVYQSGTALPATGTDIVNKDPQFVDASASNFHLKSTSPAINAGQNVNVTTDLDGNTRPAGGGFDIGPYEYGGTSVLPSPVLPPSGLTVVTVQ